MIFYSSSNQVKRQQGRKFGKGKKYGELGLTDKKKDSTPPIQIMEAQLRTNPEVGL